MSQRITEKYKVVVIGAGGAGLSTSYYLSQLGIEHVIFERGQVGNTWATEHRPQNRRHYLNRVGNRI